MNSLNYQVYVLWSRQKYRIFLSFDPAFDFAYLRREGYQRCLVLTPPLSFGKAYFLWQRLSSEEERKGQAPKEFRGFLKSLGQAIGFSGKSSYLDSLLRNRKRKAKGLLREMGTPSTGERWSSHELSSKDFKGLVASRPWEKSQSEAMALREELAGRILLPKEVEKLLEERGSSSTENLPELLQVLFLAGALDIIPGVIEDDEGPVCNRCGQRERIVSIDCRSCEEQCLLCEDCIAMGEARTCLPLFCVPSRKKPGRQCSHNTQHETGSKIQAKLNFKLTKAQEDAAWEVADFYDNRELDTCLVWAVCGAGKTEVSFGAIERALNKGEKVLFAIPRRDVVIELEPRLKSAFPGVTITALYGGSPSKFQEGQITIATTHQALRFYKTFSLIVLDEADAYPYQGSKMLYHAIQRAKRNQGKTVYMTATPGPELIKAVKRERAKKVTIPSRHHGYPIPEPELWINEKLNMKLPIDILEWLHKMAEGEKGQVFIFVPTIGLAERVGADLKKALSQEPFNLPKKWVQYSHSKDPKRDEKREGFKKGKFPFFVTTSIMERGITVPKAKVLVLYAHYEHIFDRGALVQMAGRSGRLEADPIGEVVFLAGRKTEAIKDALEDIRSMNKEARKKGYLK